MEIPDKLIFTAIKAAILAGNAIMEVYSEPFGVEYKSDNSPLTIADKRAHSIIEKELSDTGIPLLSEEGSQIGYEIRKNWEMFWLIDPLDGTKEFIKKNGDFTVNIALINKCQPIFGVVYAPVPGFLYWGSEKGSFRIETGGKQDAYLTDFLSVAGRSIRLPFVHEREKFLVLGSRSHMNIETESFIDELKKSHSNLDFVSRGSSLKFCTLAEGGADIYPRFGPTMEWDTAAGHAVALFAGCIVNQVGNDQPVEYNKPQLLNPFFIAERKKK